MIICLVGASGTGKTTIQNELCNVMGCNKIVPYTTRKPRSTEIDGRDYHFVSNSVFANMASEMAEYEEYSENRFYGTLKNQYSNSTVAIAVLTPNGIRQIRKNLPDVGLYVVFIDAPLKDRVLRYIKRCGDSFDYSDMTEISERVQRDFGMFKGFENEADLVVYNSNGTNIYGVVNDIWKKSRTSLFV